MPPADEPRPSPRERLSQWARCASGEITLAAAFLLALTLLVFGRVLFARGDAVLSSFDADLAQQFVYWRAFGFGELRAGHLALWNPHIYSGAPYFGGFQSALLYPPNWLYLCLPLARAINVGIALHVFLAGLFMFFWARGRKLHPLACVLAAVLFMFSGPYFPHIYAGHLPNLCTMVWAPLLFLAIDGWLERRTAGPLLLGAGVVAMQILAGHPQYVFYTAVAAAGYCGLHLLRAPRRVQAAAGLGAMVAGAVALSAVQLFEGFHAAGESVRSVGISMEFASMFSFPPENFLTLIVPGFFGNMTGYDYWGRCYLWEMSLFIGISGLVLAVYGALRGEGPKRRFCAAMALGLLFLALGGHTLLFKWLYLYAPGFDKFRGWSKFTFPASLFLIMLAAAGHDRLLRQRSVGRGLVNITLGVGVGLLVAAGWMFATVHRSGAAGPAPWAAWMNNLWNTHELLISAEQVRQPAFQRGAALFAAYQTLIASGTTLALGAVFLAARRHPRALMAITALAVVEMLVFVRSSLATFPMDDALDTPAAAFLRSKPGGDYRVLNTANPNLAMAIGARDIWGYDPGVLLRYAEWLHATQGNDPDDADQMLTFHGLPAIYGPLLRCRYELTPQVDAAGVESVNAVASPSSEGAARLRLISNVTLRHERDEIFTAMADPAFDPARSVIMETPPDPPPVPGGPTGTANVIAETSDSLTIEATLPHAAVLLVTDTYCSGWEARSLLPAGSGGQTRYDVLPADYCFRAIPLSAGFHRFLLEYRPRAFVIGKWTTVVALCIYLGLIVHHAGYGRRQNGTASFRTLDA